MLFYTDNCSDLCPKCPGPSASYSMPYGIFELPKFEFPTLELLSRCHNKTLKRLLEFAGRPLTKPGAIGTGWVRPGSPDGGTSRPSGTSGKCGCSSGTGTPGTTRLAGGRCEAEEEIELNSTQVKVVLDEHDLIISKRCKAVIFRWRWIFFQSPIYSPFIPFGISKGDFRCWLSS